MGENNISKKYEVKKLSKLGLLLLKREITQTDFIVMINEKFPNVLYSRSFISLHVNGKKSYMSTDTAKVFARTLEVPMEDIC